MEMNLEIMRNIDEHYVMPTYGRSPVLFVRGKGAKLFDADGREYIDFGSGIGVNSLGYADRKWVRAVQAQAKQLAHVSNLYYSPNYILLAEALCNIAGMEQVFSATPVRRPTRARSSLRANTALTSTERAATP